MTHTPDSWDRIQTLFDEALEKDAEERAAFLCQACSGDQQLFDEVASLLSLYPSAEGELGSSPFHGNENMDSSSRIPDDAIPGFQIREELHRGGQGVVYLAIQHSTRRQVALKLMLEGPFASPESRRRFEREVELVSNLSHPGIVPVFDSGVAHGQYYYAMEYIRGSHLDEYVRNEELPTRRILTLFVDICAAVDYAHQKGVIHRDIKPSNILVDDSGQIHVVDFGLARIGDTEAHETALISVTGQVMGTLAYMSPEQASGRPDQIDTRSDVYALGVVLYELLAGKLPYDLDSSMAENLSTIQHTEPTRLTLHDRTTSSEVGTIVRKALSKDKDRRYSTAGQFGDDIARFLNGDPIEAKRASTLYLLSKMLRRHIVPAVVAATFLALVCVSSIVSWSLYIKARGAQSLVEGNLKSSEKQRYMAEMYQASSEVGRNVGFTRVAELVSDWSPRSGAADLRNWEWYYLQSLRELRGGLARKPWAHQTVWSVHWHPDGDLLASTGYDGLIRIWNMDRDLPVRELGHAANRIWTARWSPDGSKLATGGAEGELKIWDVTKSYAETRLFGHSVDQKISVVSWSPDGKRLASTSHDQTIKVWNLTDYSYEEVTQPNRIYYVEWSPDGSQLVSTNILGVVKFWDPDTLVPTGQFKAHDGGSSNGDWHPDSKRILTSGADGKLKVWNVGNHKTSYVEELLAFQHSEAVMRSFWSRDGTRFVSTGGYDPVVYTWNLSARRIERYFEGHVERALCADWHPNGKLLASGGGDGVRVWKCGDSAHPPRRTIELPGKGRIEARCIELDPTGVKLAVVMGNLGIAPRPTDSALLLCDLETEEKKTIPIPAKTATWSPDGTKLLVVLFDGSVRMVGRNGEEIESLPFQLGGMRSVAWHPKGTRLATAGPNGVIQVRDTTTWKLTRTLSRKLPSNHKLGRDVDGMRHIDWSPDGLLLICANGGMTRIWDPDGKEIHRLASSFKTDCVRWSPDNTRFIATGADGKVAIWDVSTGKAVQTLHGGKGRPSSARWSPDGSRVIVGTKDGALTMWDVESGRPVFNLLEGRHLSCDWSTDGRQVVAGTNDSRIEIWDASGGYSWSDHLRGED